MSLNLFGGFCIFIYLFFYYLGLFFVNECMNNMSLPIFKNDIGSPVEKFYLLRDYQALLLLIGKNQNESCFPDDEEKAKTDAGKWWKPWVSQPGGEQESC